MSTAEAHTTEVRPAPPLRVLLVDDHDGMRAILRTALARHPLLEIAIVGEAENGHAAVDAAARHLPEAIVMDVEMPCLDGVEATRQIVKRFPAMLVIGWTMCDEPMRNSLREAGAAVVLRKDAGLANLFEALLHVASSLRSPSSARGTESA